LQVEESEDDQQTGLQSDREEAARQATNNRPSGEYTSIETLPDIACISVL